MDGTTVGAVGLTMAGIVAGLLGTVIAGGSLVLFLDMPPSQGGAREATEQVLMTSGGGGACCCMSSVALLAVGGVLFARRKPR